MLGAPRAGGLCCKSTICLGARGKMSFNGWRVGALEEAGSPWFLLRDAGVTCPLHGTSCPTRGRRLPASWVVRALLLFTDHQLAPLASETQAVCQLRSPYKSPTHWHGAMLTRYLNTSRPLALLLPYQVR